MRGGTAAAERRQGLVEGAQVPRPDVSRALQKICQRGGLVEQELRQPAVAFPQIAGGAGSHYVAAGAVAATQLRLHMIDRQCGWRVLLTAVHAPPFVPLEHCLAFHDGRVS